MKKSSRIVKILEKRKVLVLSLIFLIFLLALYKSDTVMIDIPKKLSGTLSGATGIDVFSYWLRLTGYTFRFEENINPLRMKKNLLDGTLPVYTLELSPNDLRHFDNLSEHAMELGHMPDDANEWRSAKLYFSGQEYKINVKYLGDTPHHWARKTKSYQIKTERGEYVNNMRRFGFILFEDRLFKAKIARVLAQKLGLADIRDDIVVLRINGVVQGVYYLQERLDANFLEYNQCSNCYVVRLSDNWVEDHPYNVPPYRAADENGIFWASGHRGPFDYELANLDVDETLPNTADKVHNQANELFEHVKDKNPEVIKFFDLEQLSSFEAFRMLIGNPHMVIGDNLHMIYSATNSKFYPIPDSEHIDSLILKKGGFENYLNTYAGRNLDLFRMLAFNDELRHLKHKKLYDFIMNNNLLEEYDSIVKEYGPYAASYKINKYSSPDNSRHMKYVFREHRSILKNNMNLIKSNLEYSKVYANVIAKGNKIKIEVLPDSIAEIKFKRLRLNLSGSYSGKLTFRYSDENNVSLVKSMTIEKERYTIDLMDFVDDLYFSAGLDEELYPRKRYYHLEVTFDDADMVALNAVDLKMFNDISGKDINYEDTYIQIADGNDYYNLKPFSFEEFRKEYPEFRWTYDASKDELTLLGGDYKLIKDLIIPEINNLVIEPGTRISISEGKSILSYGPVEILGTREKKVIIKALNKAKPFGTFAILGRDKKDSRSTINWLDISDGSEKWINGIYFSGQLSIYHMNVDMSNSVIHGSYSDDGLNIKYSDVVIDNCKFHENSADQVDLDFVTGTVKNSEFSGTGEEGYNGDSLDISGSKILLKNNIFSNSLDKGVSIGEETKAILHKNKILDNNMGVAVKDSSHVYLVENTFKNNNIAVNSYQKKQLFGGGSSYSYNNEFISNGKDYDKDDKSKNYKISFTEERYNRLEEAIVKESLRSYLE